ncbi:MAG: hypothetical protein M1820_006665, partial [Bogoriella megaspora]
MQRSVFFGAIVAFFVLGGLQLVTYYLPIWFQVIKNATPTKSGIMFFPTVLGDVTFSLLAGLLVTKLGYYNPWLLFGTACMSVGAGLLTRLGLDSGSAIWIGYQVLLGAGIGSIMQMAVLPLKLVPTATAVIVFFQFLGGAILLAVAESIFTSTLVKQLIQHVPNQDPASIVQAGAGAVRYIAKPENLIEVLQAYNSAITVTFYVVVGGCTMAFAAALCMEWVSVKALSTATWLKQGSGATQPRLMHYLGGHQPAQKTLWCGAKLLVTAQVSSISLSDLQEGEER